MTGWVEAICDLALVFRTGEKSIQQLFEPALIHLDDRAAFLAAVSERLRERPRLIDAWQEYSWAKRTGRGPYFEQTLLEVGFYDKSSGRHDVRLHADPAEACADFICREATWVLRGVRTN